MSKTVKTIYKCDICGKKVATAEDLTDIRLPVEELTDSYLGSYHLDLRLLDLCDECVEKYVRVIRDHFAEIYDESYGSHYRVIIKDDDDSEKD